MIEDKNTFLKEIKEIGLNSFIEKYHFDTKEEGNLILLDYNQIYSPKFSLADSCRGIILNKETLEIVCRPYSRFYNLGEHISHGQTTATFDDLIVREKLDGSLIKVYFYNNEWRWATRSMINGNDSPLYYQVFKTITFGEIIEQALQSLYQVSSFQEIAEKWILNPKNTYLFELTSPYNKVVVEYKEPNLSYLGAIENATGDYAKEYIKWKSEPKTFYFASNEHIHKIKNSIDSRYDVYDEGVVVYDRKTNLPLYKIKTSLYVKLHYIRGNGLTLKKAIEIVSAYEEAEYLSYFPEDKEAIKRVAEFRDFLIEQAYDFLVYVEHQKWTNKELGLLMKDNEKLLSLMKFNFNLSDEQKLVIVRLACHAYFAAKKKERNQTEEKDVNRQFVLDWMKKEKGFCAECILVNS